MDKLKKIRTMEKDFGFQPLEPGEIKEIDVGKYERWLLSGYERQNHYAETLDF